MKRGLEAKPRILLLSMPKAARGFDNITKFPQLGLVSIASNIDNADVRVADLILRQNDYLNAVGELINDFKPDIIGLTAMSFQYGKAKEIARYIKENFKDIKIVIGGYHASLMYEEIAEQDAELFDFIVRGEGEFTFNELVQNLNNEKEWSKIDGLSYKNNGQFVHNKPRALADLNKIKLPNRDVRVFDGFYLGDFKADTAETSRGCTFACKFCSITQMYGRKYREYSIARVIEDLKNIKEKGTQFIFFVDDNITLNVKRFERLCDAIIENGLNDLKYIIQASCRGIAIGGEQLVKKMAEAGFYWVFLGIENPIETNLKDLNKGSTETEAVKAVNLLKSQNIGVIGGLIVGNPNDDENTIKAAFDWAKKLKIDMLYAQMLHPYPKTEIRKELLAQGLVTNQEGFDRYDGMMYANVKTNYLTPEQIEQLYFAKYVEFYLDPGILSSSLFIKRHPRHFLNYTLEYALNQRINKLIVKHYLSESTKYLLGLFKNLLSNATEKIDDLLGTMKNDS